MKFSLLPQPAGLLKLMLDLFCISDIDWRELSWRDFIKYKINIVMCWDACESICFKLGTMLGIPKLYSLIPVWMTLVLTGKLDLV